MHHISKIKYRWIYQKIISLKSTTTKLLNRRIYYPWILFFCTETFSYFFWSDNLTLNLSPYTKKRSVIVCCSVRVHTYTRERMFIRERDDTKDTEVCANIYTERIVMIECSRLVHIYISFIFFYLFFSRGELNTCWYILLSGSVFIDSTMYLPRARYVRIKNEEFFLFLFLIMIFDIFMYPLRHQMRKREEDKINFSSFFSCVFVNLVRSSFFFLLYRTHILL